ncbi:unnamed protein product [Psylliodes chrysocephalus]|uniref:Uncharacterized protein n=1 Tax=Psylliodes chrysocephalus TaxID=3402493 RepID=A0A9P0GJ60_9CUCU|nr:unnamed protein product [Psylliodes chrysocephala]
MLLMGQIPFTRLSREVRAFVNTGMDYFRPIYVEVSRRKKKRWGVIFTCMAVRAVHLEVAHTLNTDLTPMAITQFVDGRGKLALIPCDNLKAAVKQLGIGIKDEKLTDSMTAKEIVVVFTLNNPNLSEFLICIIPKLQG